MAASKSIYRRLAGRGTTWTHYVHLYLGPGHLLQCASTGYSETYKRFYFRDIQAIIIRKSAVWVFWALFWLLPATTCALVALFASAPSAALALWVITGGLLLPVLANILLGPTCSCHIRTAVQTEKLPSVKRLGRARKLLAQLQPLIEAAQGKLTSEESPARRPRAQAPGTSAEAPPLQEITQAREAGPSSIIHHPSSNPGPATTTESFMKISLVEPAAPSEPIPSSTIPPPPAVHGLGERGSSPAAPPIIGPEPPAAPPPAQTP